MTPEESPTGRLTLATFREALESTFTLQATAETTVELVLVKAVGRRTASGGEDGSSFSIVFRGPSTPMLPQRMYALRHPALGGFDLFIVPVGHDQTGLLYEAVFNRMPDKEEA